MSTNGDVQSMDPVPQGSVDNATAEQVTAGSPISAKGRNQSHKVKSQVGG